MVSSNLWARDLKITLPRRGVLTPVQRLNREGVDAVRRKQYEKAEAIFYKAYLYDPIDPFTLNNLGYVSELQGDLDHAQKFYAMAAEQGGGALVDRSNAKEFEGKPMSYALSGLKDTPMRIDHMNVDAIELLSHGRNDEADQLLQKALSIQPSNVFTLNNLGVAKEATGDYDDALKYYNAAAAAHSSEPVVLTLKRSWRGKPVSEMAADSARQLKKRMHHLDTVEAQAALLNFQGVSAVNRNDWTAAKQDFLKAYSIDPQSGFSLNNYGYLAERQGDLETAQLFYGKARKANDANARIGLASDRLAEGKHLVAVVTQSSQKVNGQIEQESEAARQRKKGPIELKHRDGTPANPTPQPQKTTNPGSPKSGEQPPR